MLPKNQQIHILANKEINVLANKKTGFSFRRKPFSQITENVTLRSRFFLLPDLTQKHV